MVSILILKVLISIPQHLLHKLLKILQQLLIQQGQNYAATCEGHGHYCAAITAFTLVPDVGTSSQGVALFQTTRALVRANPDVG